MLPFFWYMLKVVICSGILFGYYWLFLRNKIFHQYNRFYLLAAMSLSLLLPLLKINFWQPTTDKNEAIRVLQAVSAGDEYMNNIVVTAHRTNWNTDQLYLTIYSLVCIIFLVLMFRTIWLIRGLLKKYPAQQVDAITFINTEDDSTPFSFLKYIFWNNNIDMGTSTGRQIFKHEVAHIQERHTHDKLFVNIILIFCWCNPFFWLYRKELNMIHEFIADKKAVEDSDTASFAAMILQAAYPKHQFELVNNFFYSPIKRSLMMLTKNKNPRVNYIGRIMVLPLAVLVFAAFTLKAKTSNSLYHGKTITVVIDAGHGGNDLGATSANGVYEKDLALAISKKVKELNSNDAIDIVLTRDADVYMDPQQKVAFAKNKNADLFISFHVDNGPKELANKYTGISFWVSKDEYSNSGSSKMFASAIVNEFNNNYQLPVMPELNQRQAGVWILQANTCPAVLIEAGYINNDKDLAYLQTSAAKETIAKNVLTAIEKFASANHATINTIQNTTINTTKITTTYLPNSKLPADTVPTRAISITGVNPNNPPLYIVNGKETDKITVDKIDPKNIEDIRVIKDATATQVYGDKGKNGVIIINMKAVVEVPGSFTAGSMTIHDNDNEKTLGTNPLLIVDNVEYPGKTLNDIVAKLGLKKLEKVDVYSGAEAMKTYGEKAKDGAIIAFSGKQNLQVTEVRIVPDDISMLYKTKLDSGNITQLKLKLVQELQNKVSLDYSERVLLDKIKQDQDVSGLKQKLLAEQQSKNQDYNVKIVEGKKLQEAKLVEEKRLLEKQSNSNTQKLAEVKNLQLARPSQDAVIEQKQVAENLQLARIQSDKVFTAVESVPTFIGGDAAWRDYLQKHLDASVPANEGWKAGKYTVIVKFIVRADGTISDVTTENYKGSKTAQACINLIKNSPDWQPAVQNGRKVNAYHKQPVTFVIEQ